MGDNKDSPDMRHKHWLLSSLQQSHDLVSAAINGLAEQLSVLSGQIDMAVSTTTPSRYSIPALRQLYCSIEGNHTGDSATTITAVYCLGNCSGTQDILKSIHESACDPEWESLIEMFNKWKKNIKGQWGTVQEGWSQERKWLSMAKKKWESWVQTLELGLVALQQHDWFLTGNRDIKINGGSSLVMPSSLVSVNSNSGYTKSWHCQTSSS